MVRRYPTLNYKPRSVKRLESKNRKKLVITIIAILIFSYIFIFYGLPWIIGSLSVLNKFKTTKTPKQVTEDITLAPPVLNIPFEATNTSSIRFKGYSLPNAKVELYVDNELKDEVSTQSDGSFIVDNLPLSLGSNTITGKSIDEKGKRSLSSKGINIFYSNEKPKLEVTEPQDNQEVKGGDKKVKVSGKTDPNNHVSVNSQTAIVNGEGNFTIEVQLNDGDNPITVLATNSAGNTTVVSKIVKYTP